MKSSRREVVEKRSEIGSLIEELSMMPVVKPSSDENHDQSPHIPTKPFLSLCYLVLQVLDKIGPTMAVLRQDMYQNIKVKGKAKAESYLSQSISSPKSKFVFLSATLELMHESNPSVNTNLVEILNSEVSEGNARKGSSCSKAFVWLTRTLDYFTSFLLQTLEKDPEKRMEQVVEDAYEVTLKPWHGWISSTAFRVALRLVPERKTFVDFLKTKDENYDTLKEKMKMLISLFGPFLEDIHCILRLYNLDMLKST